MKNPNELKVLHIIVLLLVMACCACAGPEKTPMLDEAQAAYQKAENNPDVNTYAPVLLREARQELDKAADADDERERMHHAYMAEHTVQLAEVTAQQRKTEDEVEQLRVEQHEFLLKAQVREANQARKEAEQARAELEQYRTREQQEEITRAQRRGEDLEQELARLRQTPQQRTLMAEMTLGQGGILFETGRAVLMPGSMLAIDKLASYLQRNPNLQIVIEGHADSTGTAERNQELSQRRADAVATALQSRGISQDRILARGLGQAFPVASNDTPAGRQQNRRVNISFLERPQMEPPQMGQPQIQQPRTEQPQMQQPPTEQPEMQQPETAPPQPEQPQTSS